MSEKIEDVKVEEVVETATEETIEAPVSEVETLLDTLAKSVDARLTNDRDYNEKALEAIAKGCDAIVEKSDARHDELNTRLADLADVVKAMNERFDSLFAKLADKTEELDATVNKIAEQPVVKSIRSASDVIAHPAEAPAVAPEAPAVTASDLISKAMEEIKTAPEGRRNTLVKAISQLECGISPTSIKREFNL